MWSMSRLMVISFKYLTLLMRISLMKYSIMLPSAYVTFSRDSHNGNKSFKLATILCSSLIGGMGKGVSMRLDREHSG